MAYTSNRTQDPGLEFNPVRAHQQTIPLLTCIIPYLIFDSSIVFMLGQFFIY